MATLKITAQDVETMARTIYGEARGESSLGQQAVGHVILNRANADSWWGKTITNVCLHPQQFSAWNKSDPNRVKMTGVDLSDPVYRDCMLAALTVLLKEASDRRPYAEDPTRGATHYHSHDILPRWALGKDGTRKYWVSIGGHAFYRNID